jgi:hypothetical protein
MGTSAFKSFKQFKMFKSFESCNPEDGAYARARAAKIAFPVEIART